MKIKYSGSPKMMDMCLHAGVWIAKINIAPATITERMNEAALAKVPSIIAANCQKIPLKQIGEEGTAHVIHSTKSDKQYRRRSDKVTFPKPHNLYIHKCCTHKLHSVRAIIQLLWLHAKYSKYSEDWYAFYNTGSVCTKTYFSDPNMRHRKYYNVCVCNEPIQYENEESVIEWKEYEPLIKNRLNDLSSTNSEKEINKRFPALHEMKDDCAMNETSFELSEDNSEAINPIVVASVTCFCNRPTALRQMIQCTQCKRCDHIDCAKMCNAEVTSDNYICRRQHPVAVTHTVERMDVESVTDTEDQSFPLPINVIDETKVESLVPKPTQMLFSDQSMSRLMQAPLNVSNCGGLENIGQSCYLNAVLQLLYNCTVWRAYTEISVHTKSCSKNSGEVCWLCLVLEIRPSIIDNSTISAASALFDHLTRMFYAVFVFFLQHITMQS